MGKCCAMCYVQLTLMGSNGYDVSRGLTRADEMSQMKGGICVYQHITVTEDQGRINVGMLNHFYAQLWL